uniref:Retrotransposon Copia-like N-terminal domain-containing protein n=1 Tax=Fagus sylvatica TaxID=28930 RepID=A0A2N9HPM9_FAGSY
MSSTSSSSTISSTSAAPTSFPQIQHLITIKLNCDNYLLWKAQIVPYLRGQHLYGFIDGTKPAPPPFLAVQASSTTAILPNLEFSTWHTQDQMILSALISSLSKTVLAYVVKCTTSRDVWLYLECMFTSQSCARSMQLNYQISTLKKSDSSMLISTTNSPPWPTLLLANFANRSFSNCGGRGGKSSTPLASSNSGHSFTSNQQRQHRGCGRGRGTYNNSPRPVFQVCIKSSHTALTCYHRFDNSYTVESTPNMQALLATPNHAPDPNWYSDSGATHHLTSDLANLNVRANEYHGLDQIRVGFGFGENTVMWVE